jgi:hypothetical protein
LNRSNFSDGSDTDSSCKGYRIRIRRLTELRDQEQVQDSEEDESGEIDSTDMSKDLDSSMDGCDETRIKEGDFGMKNLKALGPGGKGPWCCFTPCNGEEVPFAWFAWFATEKYIY